MDSIAHFMGEDLVKVDVGATVFEASKLMTDNTVSSVLVTSKGKPEGIFTPTDIMRRVVAEKKDPLKVKVGEVVSRPLVSMEGKKPMMAAFILMNQMKVRHIVVQENGEVVGILSVKDIASYVVNKFVPKEKK